MRSPNHCCSGKALIITYAECVSVALGIEPVMCMRPIVLSPVVCRFCDILPYYLIKGIIFKNIYIYIYIYILLLRCHYSPIQTFASSMDFSQSAVFGSVIPVCNLVFINIYFVQFHHLFFGLPLCRIPWWYFLNTWITFLLLCILLSWPIQFNRPVLTNESVPETSNRWFNSSLYRCH